MLIVSCCQDIGEMLSDNDERIELNFLSDSTSSFLILLTWSAYSVDVGDPSLWTRAYHGPHWHSIKDVAASVLQTRLDDGARIDAFLPDTYQFIRTVDVDSALRFVGFFHKTSFAIGEWISQRKVLRTATGSYVILHIANRVLRTR